MQVSYFKGLVLILNLLTYAILQISAERLDLICTFQKLLNQIHCIGVLDETLHEFFHDLHRSTNDVDDLPDHSRHQR
jgi:hypothetical protein